MAQYNSFNSSGSTPQYNYQQAGAGNGPSPAQRFLVLGAIIVGVIILIIVFFSVIGGGEDGGPTQDLAQITARHENVLSIIDTYENNIRTLETQNEAARTKAILLSDLQALKSIGASSALVTAATDSTITDQLDSAAASTNFDSVFSSVLRDEIEANTLEMQALFNSTSNTTLRETLDTTFTNQSALLE